MKDTRHSTDAVEEYLLAASLSPELQEFVLRSADVAMADGPKVPVVFGSLSDPALLAEVERAAESSGGAITRRHGSSGTLAIFRFERSLIEAIRLAHRDHVGASAPSADSVRKLERRRKALRAMFLFDFIGSLGRTDLQDAPVPAFTVTVDEASEMAVMTFEGQTPVLFPLSSRTVRLIERVSRLEQEVATRFVFRAA